MNSLNDKLIDVHINNLNNIQKIISRLLRFIWTIYTIAITICSILIPVIYTIKTTWEVKLIIVVCLIIILFSLFTAKMFCLRDERRFRNIYNQKTKIDLITSDQYKDINKKNNFNTRYAIRIKRTKK